MGEPALDEDGLTRRATERLSGAAKGRRAGEPRYLDPLQRTLTKWATIVGSAITLGSAVFAGANLWFQSDAEAAQAQAAVLSDQAILALDINKERERNDKQDVILGQINGKLDRSEILALKTERRGLRADLDAMRPGAPGRRRLEKQLETVEDDLKARGVQ